MGLRSESKRSTIEELWLLPRLSSALNYRNNQQFLKEKGRKKNFISCDSLNFQLDKGAGVDQVTYCFYPLRSLSVSHF